MMKIELQEAARLIKECDNALIIQHEAPDGDTVGSGLALCRAMRLAGKKVNVICQDEYPANLAFLGEWYEPMEFEARTIIAVDVADAKLMGKKFAEEYGKRTDICIDHHISNVGYAEKTLLGEKSASACEVVYKLLKEAEMEIDDTIAACIYTGMATDTGCFKFDNVTPETHLIAAELYKWNVPFARINRRVFDIKTAGRIKAEQLVMSSIALHLDGKCATACITKEMMSADGLSEDDLSGFASLPLQIEGVEIGFTVKYKEDGVWKISARSGDYANVSKLCARFGGGGHVKASGCTISGSLDEVIAKLVDAAAEAIADA